MGLLSTLFKKKPDIRFYSIISAVKTLYPITTTKELKRGWIPSEKEDFKHRQSRCPLHALGTTFSINKCPAIHGIMNTGFVVYAPADFKVHTNGDESTILFTNNNIFPHCEYVTTHNEEVAQWLMRNKPNYIFPKVVKVNTPWRVSTSRDVVFLQLPVYYNDESRFTAVSGIMDPMMSHEINVQLFWHVGDGDVCIEAGTPLCQYIPVSRSLLQSPQYIIDDMTHIDAKIEDEYLYLQATSFRENLDFQTRVSRMMKIIRKYQKL